MIEVDCEGVPVGCPVDVCEAEWPTGPAIMTPRKMSPRDVEEIKRLLSIPGSQRWCQPIYPAPEPVRVRVDDGFGNIDPEKVSRDGRVVITGAPSGRDPFDEAAEEVRRRWTSEAARDLLTRTLEAEADALSFPPDAPEAAAEPITIVAESVAIPKIKIGQVWQRGSWVPDGQIRTDMERIRIVRYQALGALWGVEPASATDSWALCWIGESEIRTAFELEAEPVAPQAVTLEVATINASEPGEYRSPADAHLPAPEVSRG